MNQGDLGDLGNLDTATLLQHLPGVRFPAEKEQVAATAEKNDAPQELATQLSNAETERFESAEEVMQALQSTPDPPTPFSLPGLLQRNMRACSLRG